MRAKRPYIVLSFRTTVEAMAWEKHCEAEHIPGRLIPLPRELSAGCGLAWRMPPEDWQLWQIDSLMAMSRYQEAMTVYEKSTQRW